jgi:curved DNA-binding protein CbpA
MKDSYKNKLYVLQETNYYKILGVNETDPVEHIAKEYRVLAKMLHPDKHPGIAEKEKNELGLIFKKVNQAYEIIKDPLERKKFDSELKLKRAKEKAAVEYNLEYTRNKEEQAQGQPQPEAPQQPETVPPQSTKEPEKPPEKADSFQKYSPIKNDPRLRGAGGFTFQGLKAAQEVDRDSVEKTRKEKELAQNKITFNKAKMYLNEQNYDDAISLLRFLTEKDSKKAEYHSLLGLAMESKGWNGYAQAEYKVALHYDPNDPVALKHYQASVPADSKTGPLEKSVEKAEEAKGIFGKIKSFFSKD